MAVNPDKLTSSNSTRSFITALVANGGLLIVEVGAFLVLKQRLGRIYSPRTYLPPPEKRAEELPQSWWRWLPALLSTPSEDIIRKNGLDAYMFLRYLKMLMKIFSVFTVLTFAVIVPINDAAVDSDVVGLERITWTNISKGGAKYQSRFPAHIVMVYVLTFFVFYMIQREMLHFIHMRHEFLISPSHSKLPQARTVLITNVPEELATEHDLRQFASFVPGGIDRIWIYRDTRELNDMFEERTKACSKLEKAETHILHHATNRWRMRVKAHKEAKKLKTKDEESVNNELVKPSASYQFLEELVPRQKRPTHKTGFLGLFGTKVDTIGWCKAEISRLNANIKDAREHAVKGKFLGSVFIRCNLQLGAHVLAQCVPYHEANMMYHRWMEANPADIVWANLDDGALEMRGRYLLSWILNFALIVGWAFPVSAIGALSNLDDLCQKVNWLKWVCTAPSPAPSIIQGILPPVLLAILFAVLPFILRALAWYECIPRYSLISLSVYRRFFIFLLVHGFLIVSVSSSITTAIQDIIDNPTKTVQTLAAKLPSASVFFLTYMVTQGLAGAGAALAQLLPLIIFFIRKWFLGNTPRQAYGVTFLMPSADFGVILPRLSLLATIGFAYSVLNPLINFLALMSYAMYFLAWKFLFTQVFDQPDQTETGGLYFPLAMSNLFAGLYIEQICLAALFFLNASADAIHYRSIIEGVLMLALVAITVLVQVYLNKSFSPITNYLPMSLAIKKMAKRFENERREKAGLSVDNNEEEIDLFSRDHMRHVRRRLKAIPKKLDSKLDTLKAKMKGESPIQDGEPKDERPAQALPIARLMERKSADLEAATAVASGAQTYRDTQVASPTDGAPTNPALDGAPELFRKPTDASHTSKKSKGSSHKSGHSKDKDSLDKALQFDAPAAAGVDLSDDDASDDEDLLEEHAFDHPSMYVEQAWIWLPKDTLGLSEVLTEDLKAAGVDASDVGAVMDDKGIVEVTRNPPDEEWTGGHDR